MSGVQTPSPSSGPGGSASVLPGHPKRGAGVRRLNHVPIMCGVALLCAVVGAVGYTYHARIMATAAQQASAEKRGEAGKPTVLDGAPDGGVIPAGLGSNKPMGNSGNAGGDQAKPAPTPTPAGSPPSDTGAGAGRQVDAEDDATKARRQAWLVYYQQLAELQKQRYDGATQAMRADTGVGGTAGGGASNPQPIGSTPSMDAPGGQQAMQMPPGMGGPGGAYGSGYGGAYGGYAPAPAERPFGGWFDELADELGTCLDRRGIDRGVLQQVTIDRGEITFYVRRESLLELCRTFRDEEGLRFELCSSVSGVDYGTEVEQRLHVVYHLQSMTHNRRLRVETTCPDDDPHVPSVVPLYPAADWHERETYDMFGIVFDGHPHLTRILMPDDWVGHPQRKDYPLGGIPVEYKGAQIPPPDQRRAYT